MKIEKLDKYNTEKKNFKKDILENVLSNTNINTDIEDNIDLIEDCFNNNVTIYNYEDLVNFIDCNYACDAIKTDNPYVIFDYDSFIRDCIYGSQLIYHNIDCKERDLFNEKWLNRTFYVFNVDIDDLYFELDRTDFVE